MCVYIYVCVYMYILTSRPCILLSQRVEEDKAIGAVCVHVSALCGCLWPVWLAVYMCIYVLYTHGLCACAYCEYIISLATDWTWGHGAAAALPL